MGLDAFGRMVRDIRLVRAMLLYDMAKDLDISSVELSAIECGRKPVPDWFISKLQEKYGISDMHAQSLIKFMNERGEKNCPGMIEKTQRVTQTPQLTKLRGRVRMYPSVTISRWRRLDIYRCRSRRLRFR